MRISERISPCLWFESQAEAAARFYTEIFPGSKITEILRYTREGHEVHGRPEGSVMVVAFELDGQPFTALNGGPAFTFNEAISFQVHCETQAEVDHYWDKLSDGGDPAAQQCGWLKDRYGVSWQVVPRALLALLADPDRARAGRAMQAMLPMKKIDIETVRRAAAG
jgi:predicted 3-demethylubiquinone-9 3-methyltransferase (glyoxalase superfamily)